MPGTARGDRRLLAAGVGLTLAVAAAAFAPSASGTASPVYLAAATGQGLGGNCHTARVFLHDGRGHYVRPKAGQHAGACAVQTGYQTSETRIAIGNDGGIVQQPAFLPNQTGAVLGTGGGTAGVAWSGNGGRSWQVRLPRLQPGGVSSPEWSGQDTNIFIDPATNRLFASAPQLQDQWLAYSDDEGATWYQTRPPYLVSSENPHFLFAPAPAGQAQPSGYPNVVYWCTELTVFATSGGVCEKSLDGGNTWALVGQGTTGNNIAPAHSECGSSGDSPMGPGNGGYPVATPDGALYLVVTCGGKSYLARSLDEGATWPVVRHAGAPVELRFLAGQPAPYLLSDLGGNLYVVQSGGSLKANVLLLRASRDRGLTWTKGVNVVPPGMTGVSGPGYDAAARQPGRVAISFTGTRQGGTGLDAWLVATSNATSERPAFEAAMLNNPKTPVLWQARGSAPWPFLDFLGAAIGPDGSAYGSYIQDCGPNLNDGVACPPHPDYNNTGFVGRLLPVS
jgi:hypothetical protein